MKDSNCTPIAVHPGFPSRSEVDVGAQARGRPGFASRPQEKFHMMSPSRMSPVNNIQYKRE